MSSQRQSGGDGSVNLQGQSIVIHQGLSVEEVRTIALDIFRSNFYELAGFAKDVAEARAQQITNQFLEELQERNPEGLDRAIDPDMQYAIFTAQREYARSGDKQLGDILVDILVDRSKEEGRTILQIVLNESLQVAPKLTSDQLATLSIVFTLKYTKYLRMTNLEALRRYLDERIIPFVPELTSKNSCYQHLEYAGCASIGIGSVAIEKIFLDAYPGMFSKGFTRSDLTTEFPGWTSSSRHEGIELFTPCLHDNGRMQLNAIDDDMLESAARNIGYDDSEVASLKTLRSGHSMQANEVRDYLEATHPVMKGLFEVWYASLLKNLTLTSVGIAIGHANARRVIKDVGADLAIWVN